MKYHQLTYEERYLIARLRVHRLSIPKIAAVLGRHRSTIWREIHRNLTNNGRYQVAEAQSKTNGRRRRSRRNHQFTHRHFLLVLKYLKRDYSPEQIAGTLKRRGLLNISHETIYQYIWEDRRHGGLLYMHLRQSSKLRRKRRNIYESRGRLAGKRMIDDRPKIVDSRRNKGHWEIDTVMGGRDTHCIVTLLERKTGYVLIGKCKNRTATEVNTRTIQLIESSGLKFDTITADNGTEFHAYKEVEKKTGTRFFFAHPYHSWERPCNENVNGLIRQYLPKRASMAHVTQQMCNGIARKLNSRPRKRFGFRSPEEMMYARA